MTPLSLTLRRNSLPRIDMAPLIPDRLAGMDADGIARMRLHCGRRRVRVGDLFLLAGSDPRRVQIRRSTSQLFHIGFQMESGTIEISGNAGDNLGENMRGGEIVVRGDAGEWVGAAMLGGRIHVHGNVAGRVGAAPPGQQHGMRDGMILVAGTAGDRLGERMRGGTIVVFRDAGAFMACRMTAGTIILLGMPGPHVGFGMKRGTLVLGRRPRTPPMGFRSSGAMKMEFLRLLFKQAGAADRDLALFREFGPEVIRLAGDLTVGGKGEILVLLNAGQAPVP